MTVPSVALLEPDRSYVPVLVPAALLGDVYRLLTDAAGASVVPSQPVQTVAAEDESDGWSGEADARFRDASFVRAHLVPRSATVKGAAKHLANRANTWISSEEIATALGLQFGWNSLAGALGAAGRYFANRDIGVPWDWTYDTPDGRIRLKMDAAIAEVVLSEL